jgi:hypothetical protein
MIELTEDEVLKAIRSGLGSSSKAATMMLVASAQVLDPSEHKGALCGTAGAAFQLVQMAREKNVDAMSLVTDNVDGEKK